MTEQLTILYQDEDLVLINKPIGLPIHKTKGMAHDAPYVTQLLGKQLDCSVYNVHRLDAKTSGVLLLALSPEIASELTEQFAKRDTIKIYEALVKGQPKESSGVFDTQVMNAKRGRKVKAHTAYTCLDSVATGWEHKGDENVIISRLELRPTTGRWHQLRQHCAKYWLDMLGDAQHGDWGLNHKLVDAGAKKRLYLHAKSLTFTHPTSGETMTVESAVPPAFDVLWGLFREKIE